MTVSTIRAEFPCELEKVWDIVTSLQNHSWRSDLRSIVVLEEGRAFEEHTSDGFVTRFTITSFVSGQRYELDMENDNMAGHWTGLFSYREGRTEIEFTEDVVAKKWYLRPFVGPYLKRQQAAYVSDLRRELER